MHRLVAVACEQEAASNSAWCRLASFSDPIAKPYWFPVPPGAIGLRNSLEGFCSDIVMVLRPRRTDAGILEPLRLLEIVLKPQLQDEVSLFLATVSQLSLLKPSSLRNQTMVLASF